MEHVAVEANRVSHSLIKDSDYLRSIIRIT